MRVRFVPPLLALLVASMVFVACSSDGDGGSGLVIVDPPPGLLNRETLRATYDSVWSVVDAQYPYLAEAPNDWAEVHGRYRPAIDTLRTHQQFRALLLDMLAELEDENVGMRDTSGALFSEYLGAREKNFRRTPWENTVYPKGFTEMGSWGYAIIDTIGYLTFRTWNPASFHTEDFDQAMESMRDLSAIIIDLRIAGVPVEPLTRPTLDSLGSSILSEDVLTRFLDETRTVATTMDPESGATSQVTVSPRGGWTFTRPVVALMGEGTINEGEVFAMAMGELPHVTLMGDTTAGLAGATEGFVLSADWEYVIPTLGYARVDGTALHGHPLLPDVEIPWSDSNFENGKDGVLNSAIQWLSDYLES